ncbi:MAG: type II toxin-antitoxin system death-on-curing family toxin [Clostridia bacterium]|nr:type II toxin-antitoxin system death-on-curing family toxin [Clostridia bacterium]
MIWLTKEQVISLHTKLIEKTGGTDGIRDDGLLDAALHAPFHTFETNELYRSLCDKAARLAYGLTQNHPFVDGNKRIGAHALLVVLTLNGVIMRYNQQELVDLFLGIASGKVDFEELKKWVVEHVVKG